MLRQAARLSVILIRTIKSKKQKGFALSIYVTSKPKQGLKTYRLFHVSLMQMLIKIDTVLKGGGEEIAEETGSE